MGLAEPLRVEVLLDMAILSVEVVPKATHRHGLAARRSEHDSAPKEFSELSRGLPPGAADRSAARTVGGAHHAREGEQAERQPHLSDYFYENFTSMLTGRGPRCNNRFTVIFSRKTSHIMAQDIGKKQALLDKEKRYNKDTLFENFFLVTRHALEAFELQLGLNGLRTQLLGDSSDEEEEKQRLRESHPWQTLSDLYEYSLNGVLNPIHDGADSLVIDGSDVLKIINTEDYSPSIEWEELVAMGDGRVALDWGQDVLLEKLALLANVDLRTIRNAVSGGALRATKVGDCVFVDNASARRWLYGRRGFKPTASTSDEATLTLASIETPDDFGRLLQAQRTKIESEASEPLDAPHHEYVSKNTVRELESGIFSLPLDAVFPIADYYMLGRNELLECVMRVFFAQELAVLKRVN